MVKNEKDRGKKPLGKTERKGRLDPRVKKLLNP